MVQLVIILCVCVYVCLSVCLSAVFCSPIPQYEPETHNLDLLSVTSDIPLTTMVQPPVEDEPLGHSNIPVAKFEQHVKRLHANQNGLFAEEYKVRL